MDTRENKKALHVLPINDLRPHVESEHCWCKPKLDESRWDGIGKKENRGKSFDFETLLQPPIWIHNSMDKREEYERGQTQ